MAYKVVHTGPNKPLGGLNEGFTKAAYHVGISEKVKNPPKAPTVSVAVKETMNFKLLL